ICTTSFKRACEEQRAWNKKQALITVQSIPFSAFWLRSSVVSVLISLISDTWVNGPHDIKFIFLGGEGPLLELASGAFLRRSCVALLHGPGAPHQCESNPCDQSNWDDCHFEGKLNLLLLRCWSACCHSFLSIRLQAK
ncbi:unnamed protein product, partial [Linum tenue]